MSGLRDTFGNLPPSLSIRPDDGDVVALFRFEADLSKAVVQFGMLAEPVVRLIPVICGINELRLARSLGKIVGFPDISQPLFRRFLARKLEGNPEVLVDPVVLALKRQYSSFLGELKQRTHSVFELLPCLCSFVLEGVLRKERPIRKVQQDGNGKGRDNDSGHPQRNATYPFHPVKLYAGFSPEAAFFRLCRAARYTIPFGQSQANVPAVSRP